MPGRIALEVDGRAVEVDDTGGSLLEVLREQLGKRSVKDGCSPQGQCGCCTVLIDGAPRVACVTPARRAAGRRITTVAGLDGAEEWADAFVATGGSQCGFCTPGIVCRLAALRAEDPGAGEGAVVRALAAHLCRCTGWRPIVEAWRAFGAAPSRDLAAATARATLESGGPQVVDRRVPLGWDFADDRAPADALVAVPDGRGGWCVGESLAEARAASGKVQGRRSTRPVRPPLDLPPGDWDLTLRTSWVEPAYLEPDASWCEPGGVPASPLANGGAFGAKRDSPAVAAARALADRHGRAVRVVLAREDVVRLGPKRPPVAAGVRADGSGVVRAVRTPGFAEAVASVAPALRVEEVEVAGPATSTSIRAAGWAEAAVLLAALGGRSEVRSPAGAVASAAVADGALAVRVRCGDPLDEVVLRSYCVGAAHMALGWVTSEGLAVDDHGEVQDLTIRSFGIVRPAEMPAVHVTVEHDEGPAVPASDAVFAAAAAAVWLHQGCPPAWPTGRSLA